MNVEHWMRAALQGEAEGPHAQQAEEVFSDLWWIGVVNDDPTKVLEAAKRAGGRGLSAEALGRIRERFLNSPDAEAVRTDGGNVYVGKMARALETVATELGQLDPAEFEGPELSRPTRGFGPLPGGGIEAIAPIDQGPIVRLSVEESVLNPIDRRYVEAIRSAEMSFDFTGQEPLDEVGVERLLELFVSNSSLSLAEFLLEVAAKSEHLLVNVDPIAAVTLLAASDKMASEARVAGQAEDANDLDTCYFWLSGNLNRVREGYAALAAEQATDPTAKSPELRSALRSPPDSLGRYVFHLNHDATRLIVEPGPQAPSMRTSLTSTPTTNGGRAFQIEGSIFETLQGDPWQQHSLGSLAAGKDGWDTRIKEEFGFDLDVERDVLILRGENDEPVHLIFSRQGDGVLTLCET